MPLEKTLEPQGWVESKAAFEERKKAFEQSQATQLDAAIKNGTAGRVVNDPEQQRLVREFRAAEKVRIEQAKAKAIADHAAVVKAKQELMEKKQMVKNFHDQQSLLAVDRKVPDSELASRLAKGEKNPQPKEIAKGMQKIPTYAGVLGLFKSRKPQDEQVKDLTVSATSKTVFHRV